MNSIREIIKNIYAKLINYLNGVDKNKVLFVSFSGRTYSDNPKAISEALHILQPDVDIVWAFRDPKSKKGKVPEYIRVVNRNVWREYAKEFATARVVVNNTDYRIPKGKNQFFVQTFHGDRFFKKVLYDAYEDPSQRKRKVLEEKPGYCDLALAGSGYGVRMYRSAFKYMGEVLNCGTPRDDILINPDTEKALQIKRSIGINPDNRVLLYAPTFRDRFRKENGCQVIQNIDIEETLDQLDNRDNRNWICLMRAHPGMSKLTGYGESERIIQVSDYEDMADLLLISDMLITDYSSSAGDFILKNKPVILYQSDREEYNESDRQFYFNVDDSPYMIATNQNELNEWISRINDEWAENNCKQILEFYETNESGEASRIVAERIINWIDEYSKG